MTHILLHFVSNRYGFALLRYKKSANAESCAETTRENGSDAMRVAGFRVKLCANAVFRTVCRAVFRAENGSDAVPYADRERGNSVIQLR